LHRVSDIIAHASVHSHSQAEVPRYFGLILLAPAYAQRCCTAATAFVQSALYPVPELEPATRQALLAAVPENFNLSRLASILRAWQSAATFALPTASSVIFDFDGEEWQSDRELLSSASRTEVRVHLPNGHFFYTAEEDLEFVARNSDTSLVRDTAHHQPADGRYTRVWHELRAHRELEALTNAVVDAYHFVFPDETRTLRIKFLYSSRERRCDVVLGTRESVLTIIFEPGTPCFTAFDERAQTVSDFLASCCSTSASS